MGEVPLYSSTIGCYVGLLCHVRVREFLAHKPTHPPQGFVLRLSGFRFQVSGLRFRGSRIRSLGFEVPPWRHGDRRAVPDGPPPADVHLHQKSLVRSHEERRWLFEEPTPGRVSPSKL